MRRDFHRIAGLIAAVLAVCCAASPLRAASPGGSNLLPSDYLSTKGNQIVDRQGEPVRIAGIGWGGQDNDGGAPIGLWMVNYKKTMDQMKASHINEIRLPYCDLMLTRKHPTKDLVNDGLNPDLRGKSPLEIMDAVIAYAGKLGLKIIIDHHTNSCEGGQQPNGLWHDRNVTTEQFERNWVMLARRYARNPTVIGFDLDNEPSEPATWGGGGDDWWAEATKVGDLIQAVNPDVLIIVEGLITYHPQKNMPQPSCQANLEGVRVKPIVLNVPHKLVYSVHDYPSETDDCGWNNPSARNYPNNLPAIWDRHWGFVYKEGIAPIYVGEFGTGLQAEPADSQWLKTLIAYMNDPSQGGAGMSGSYWHWGTFSAAQWGFLEEDWLTPIPAQAALLSPFFESRRSETRPAP